MKRKQKKARNIKKKDKKAAASQETRAQDKNYAGKKFWDKWMVHVEHPKRTQDLVSMLFDRYYEDGIFEKKGVYSKLYAFTDVSFTNAQLEEQVTIYKKWVELLNSFNDRTHVQLLVTSFPVRKEIFKKDFMYDLNSLHNDAERTIGREFNSLIEKTLGNDTAESLVSKRYFCVSIHARNIKEARDEFINSDLKIEKKFKEIGSSVTACNAEERFEFMYNIFKGHKLSDDTRLNLADYARSNGNSVYDQLAPETADFKYKDYFQFTNGNHTQYMRVLFVSRLSTSITPRFFNDLISMDGIDLTVSAGITPIATAEGVRMIEKQLTSMRTERLDKIKHAYKSGYTYEAVQDDRLEDSINDAMILKDDVQKNSQKLFSDSVFILVKGNTLEELENNSYRVMDKAAEQVISIEYFNYRQVEGLAQIMPFADDTLPAGFQRTLTSEATACSIPFNSKDLLQPKSIYFGMNLTSKNAIFADRKKLLNGNGCVLATSGSGKSFSMKMLIEQIYLRYPEDDIIIIDPQAEYDPLISYFRGQSIEISQNSNTHINPFDLDLNYDDKAPVKAKAEYIVAFLDTIVAGGLTGAEKSIVDRCCLQAYEAYENSRFTDQSLVPNLPKFYDILVSQPEREAKELAINLERFVKGSIDMFSKTTNVNVHNRLVCFNINHLNESYRTTGYLVVLDHIMNTLAKNKAKGKYTWIFIDEFHVLLDNRFSAQYIAKIYKEGRKRGAMPTIITQNIADVLNNEQGRKILSNSEFALILKQKPLDMEQIADIFSISDSECEYIGPDCPKGQGILVYSNDNIIFRNVVSKDSLLYRINNTDMIVQSRG